MCVQILIQQEGDLNSPQDTLIFILLKHLMSYYKTFISKLGNNNDDDTQTNFNVKCYQAICSCWACGVIDTHDDVGENIHIKVSDKTQQKFSSLKSWFCGFLGDDIFWNFEN